jgi:hypothetical protein
MPGSNGESAAGGSSSRPAPDSPEMAQNSEQDAQPSTLPLHLTEREAELLLQMCASAPVVAHESVEITLFDKLCALLMTFHGLEENEDDSLE